MVKVLPFRFQQCFGLFTTLLVTGSSETGLFRRLSKHVFWSPSVQKHISYEGHVFFENVKNWIHIFKIKKKIRQMLFCFWNTCIWRSCNKLSLLRRQYLSSEVNVLTNSPKILHITKRHFFQLDCLISDQEIW